MMRKDLCRSSRSTSSKHIEIIPIDIFQAAHLQPGGVKQLHVIQVTGVGWWWWLWWWW